MIDFKKVELYYNEFCKETWGVPFEKVNIFTKVAITETLHYRLWLLSCAFGKLFEAFMKIFKK